MSALFYTSAHCQSRVHCTACRTNRKFRENIVKMGLHTDPDFPCPFGMDGLGYKLERLLKPVAKFLKLKCLNPDSTLKPESPCAKRRDALNKLGKVSSMKPVARTNGSN